MKLAFVVPRYGHDIVGGAETQLREYAEHLVGAGHAIEVLTTCARDHFTWRNELPAGARTEQGVTVRRFPVTQAKDHGLMADLHAILDADLPLDRDSQRAWVENTGHSTGLLEGIEKAAAKVDALIFAPYLFASTVFGVHIAPRRSLVVPCLHDEAYARFDLIQDALCAAAGLLFNSPAEMRLGESLLDGRIPPHRLVGDGFAELARPPDPDGWRRRRRVDGALVAFAGRREAAKNFPLLAQWVAAHTLAIAPDRPIRLAAMGRGPIDVPSAARGVVLDLGVVAEDEKYDAMAASLAVAQLSLYESFSYVIAEGWLSGTPAIVHAGCPVTREHCERGGGGVWVESVEEFSEAVSMLLADPALRARMAVAGRAYILAEYGWPAVIERLVAAAADLVGR